MRRPKLLDLCCKAGGTSMGYYLAGFDVTGADIEPQPHYPFPFIQADVLTVDLSGYDAYAGSPPCQKYTRIQSLGKARNGGYSEHPDLVDPVRQRLLGTGKPFIIENVVGAPLINPITLCGSMFDLKVYRHRIFESNIPLHAPDHIPHNDSTPSAGNGASPKGFISVCGTGGVRGFTAAGILDYWRMAMGISWMDRRELAQAIPPAYTCFLGIQLRRAIE